MQSANTQVWAAQRGTRSSIERLASLKNCHVGEGGKKLPAVEYGRVFRGARARNDAHDNGQSMPARFGACLELGRPGESSPIGLASDTAASEAGEVLRHVARNTAMADARPHRIRCGDPRRGSIVSRTRSMTAPPMHRIDPWCEC